MKVMNTIKRNYKIIKQNNKVNDGLSPSGRSNNS